jgi:hypothetical protein
VSRQKSTQKKTNEVLYEEMEPNKKAKSEQASITVTTTDGNVQIVEEDIFHTFAEMAREDNRYVFVNYANSPILRHNRHMKSSLEAVDRTSDHLKYRLENEVHLCVFHLI